MIFGRLSLYFGISFPFGILLYDAFLKPRLARCLGLDGHGLEDTVVKIMTM